MAIAPMTKVMIVTHRSESRGLVEALQDAGIVQILNAERAMVSKEWPQLMVEVKKPRDIEEMVNRLDKAVSFLKPYAPDEGVSLFSPLVNVDSGRYTEVVSGSEALELLEETEKVSLKTEKLSTEIENIRDRLVKLGPWAALESNVEELSALESSTCFAGLIPNQHYDKTIEKLAEYDAAVQEVSKSATVRACLVVCLNDAASDVHKSLRASDFETMSFEGMEGKVSELIAQAKDKLKDTETKSENLKKHTVELAGKRLSLQILYDHFENLLHREQARKTVPRTEHALLLEGWVKTKDYAKLEKIVSGFDASTVGKMEVGKDEEVPVEIENNKAVRPFEAITRLYGMPNPVDVDPTVFLAPFFAIFFGLCLTDAAYGILLIGTLWWMLKKIQGDKKFIWMFIVCGVMTVIAGALTGGWFGDALQQMLPQESKIYQTLNNAREKLMLFDPMTEPLTFFMLSLILGYIQIMAGIVIAMLNNLMRKDYITAVFDQVVWLVFLNSLVLFGLCKGQILPAGLSPIFGWLAILMAITIFLFSERKGGLGARIGGGAFALFNTVFYFGDILSYVRLMALGMVTAGLGMAVNILVKLLMSIIPIPILSYVAGGLLFVAGHMFNLAMGILSSFVHSLRLQFVEFFPKFMVGGGKEFLPLDKKYKYVSLKKQ